MIPFDTSNSVLWEKNYQLLFVNENDRMPQDNIGIVMPPEVLNKLGTG